MSLNDQITSAFWQTSVVVLVGLLLYGGMRIFLPPRLGNQNFFSFIGILPARGQLDAFFSIFWIFWLCLGIFAILSTFLEFQFSETFHHLLTSDSSPYAKILKTGFNIRSVASGIVYCFVQAAFAEELLFRGLIGKRLFFALGNHKGNFVQALIFWLVHLVIFRLITGNWFSWPQFVTFVTSFGLGVVLGYMNFRKRGESIIPSWILHGTVNFFCFVTLAVLLWTADVRAMPLDLSIDYNQDLITKGFVSPVLSLRVNGQEGLFLIDTGASTHVLSSWFTEKAKIHGVGGGSVGGSTGENGPSSLAIVSFVVNQNQGRAFTFAKQNAFIVDLPSAFQESGIAGIISPQQLLEPGQVGVLDLSAQPSFKISKQSLHPTKHEHDLGVVTSQGPLGKKTILYTISGNVLDKSASFIVDTGAEGNSVGLNTPAGKALFPESVPVETKIGGVTGEPQSVRVVHQAKVAIHGRTLDLEIYLQPISKNMPADGMLGMKYLKGCVLILGQNQGSISCP